MKSWGNSKKQQNERVKREPGRKGKDKQKQAAIFQWLVPITVLLLIIIIMLVRFISEAEKSGKEQVYRMFSAGALRYSTAFDNELGTITKAAVPISRLMPEMSGNERTIAQKAAFVLQENSNAQKIVICDLKGWGIDETGARINISDRSYFAQLTGEGQQYLYADEEAMLECRTVVMAVPIRDAGALQGYILTYYPTLNLSKLINKIEYDNENFYLLIAEDGTVLEHYGRETGFAQQSYHDDSGNAAGAPSWFAALDSAQVSEGSTSYSRQRIQKRLSGNITASLNGERRVMFYQPLQINGWNLVMGVNQSYAEYQQNQQVKETRNFIWRLMLVLSVFSIFVVTINIFNRLRFGETSKTLENKADTDLLTGLNNKIATERKIKEYMKDSDQQALMFLLDIDNFKKINDTMGHAFGDEILRSLGFGLMAEFRVSDILGRTGGDEFMIFLKNIKDDAVIDREVGRVIRFFHDFKAGEYVKYSATASIGCAVYPKDAANFEDLYKAADKALYRAKKQGKNQLAFYENKTEISIGDKK